MSDLFNTEMIQARNLQDSQTSNADNAEPISLNHDNWLSTLGERTVEVRKEKSSKKKSKKHRKSKQSRKLVTKGVGYPKFAARLQGRTYLYTKVGKNDLRLMSGKDLAKYNYIKEDMAASRIRHEEIRLDTQHQILASVQRFNHAAFEQRAIACSCIIKAADVLAVPAAWIKIFLFVLLSRVLDIVPLPFNLRTVFLSDMTEVPDTLRLIFHIASGTVEWNGENWSVKLKPVLAGKIPIGDATMSLDAADYAGCVVKAFGTKLKVPVSYVGRSVLLASNLPKTVADRVMEISPLAIFFHCSKSKAYDIKLSGSDFYQCDLELLKEIESHKGLMAAIIESFLEWLRSKKSHQRKLKAIISEITPKKKVDRFVKETHSLATDSFTAALGVFKIFLLYCSERCDWLTEEEASAAFLVWKREIFPETVPPADVKAEKPFQLEAASNFWMFLAEYVTTYLQQISGPHEQCGSSMVGRFVDVNHEKYLIFPREELFVRYRSYAATRGCVVDGEWDSRRDTRLERILISGGFPAKTEKENTTWRYPYSTGATPDSKPKSQPCIGIQYEDLSDAIQALLVQKFGAQDCEGGDSE